MIVALLGVLKAGGAYVPLDPAYPQERLRFSCSGTRASRVVIWRRKRVLCHLLRLEKRRSLSGG